MLPLKIEVVSPSLYSPIWEILIEGVRNRSVHRSIFGKNPRFPFFGSMEEWEILFKDLEYKRTKNYLLWRLSKQNYHSEQLKKILSDRLVTEDTIERVLQEFISLGYLNDQEWLSHQIRVLKKKSSGRSIILKLRQKGISKETLEKTQEILRSPQEEEQVIRELLDNKYRKKNLNDFKERKKVVDSLIRRGFPYETVRYLIQERCECIG